MLYLMQVRFIDNELLLIGFYRKSMFVYNETKNFEVRAVFYARNLLWFA